jgi:hypothetical protein
MSISQKDKASVLLAQGGPPFAPEDAALRAGRLMLAGELPFAFSILAKGGLLLAKQF